MRPGTVAVIGTATTSPFGDDRRSLEEVLYEVAQAALADAGLRAADLDGIVVASNDQYDGRAISIMAASGSVGGVDRDILSTPSAGEHAFVLGALRIGSGQHRTQLVVAWSPAETQSLGEVQRLAADPYYHRRLPLDELSSHALQAGALEHAVPHSAAAARALLALIRENGRRAGRPEPGAFEPPRWPFEAGTIAAPTSGAVALVLASREFAGARAGTRAAWVEGLGWTTEPAFLGDRDLSRLPSLRIAADRAYRGAAIDDPREAFAIAEVADASPHQALLALEGLSLSARETWAADLASGRFAAGGRTRLNPSGGALTSNPVFCTGLMRFAEIARHVRSEGGLGVAHAASGFAMQYNAVAVFRGGMGETR